MHQHINSTEMQQPEPADAGEGGREGCSRAGPDHNWVTHGGNNNNNNLPKSLSPRSHPSPSRRCLPALLGDGGSACGRSCCLCLSHDRSSVREGCADRSDKAFHVGEPALEQIASKIEEK